MDQVITRDMIDQLSIEERLELIGELCESLEDEAVPITRAQAEEIDRRLASYESDRNDAITWDELKARIQRRQ
jgi:putative addiction module component (TIGR02574 family)